MCGKFVSLLILMSKSGVRRKWTAKYTYESRALRRGSRQSWRCHRWSAPRRRWRRGARARGSSPLRGRTTRTWRPLCHAASPVCDTTTTYQNFWSNRWRTMQWLLFYNLGCETSNSCDDTNLRFLNGVTLLLISYQTHITYYFWLFLINRLLHFNCLSETGSKAWNLVLIICRIDPTKYNISRLRSIIGSSGARCCVL